MLIFTVGNLFNSKAQTLVNTVNCAGVMGKGVALEFKKRFPEMFEEYHTQCLNGRVMPGVLIVYKKSNPWVLNFPTKEHWKGKSKLTYINQGLQALKTNYQVWNITSLAMPALGCGLGGLDWQDVRPLIEKYLADVEMDIEVYEPGSSVTKKEEDPKFYSVDLFGKPVPPPEKKKKTKRRRRSSLE
jgi:O-acetyl-ADP-ribose deacetylase (regulator of RNase III)